MGSEGVEDPKLWLKQTQQSKFEKHRKFLNTGWSLMNDPK